MRTYHLYAKPSGKYEIIPEGFSEIVFFLAPLWVFANGLFVEFFAIMAVFSIPLFIIGSTGTDSAVWGLVGFASFATGYIYFVSIAYKLRAKDLKRYGYEKIATIESSSARSALREWSQTDEAAKIVEDGVPNGPITRF